MFILAKVLGNFSTRFQCKMRRVLSQVIKSFDLFKAPRTFNALQIVLQLTACTANKFAILCQPLLLSFLLLLLSSNLPCFLWLYSKNKVSRLDKVLQAAKQTPFPTTFPLDPPKSSLDLPLFAALKFLRVPFVYCRAKVEMQNAKILCTAAPKSFDNLQEQKERKNEKTEMKIQIGKRICAARH